MCPDSVTITVEELKAIKASIQTWDEFATALNAFFDPWKVIPRAAPRPSNKPIKVL